ncbi:MAG: hypothetical protein CM1200mP29_00490 [Verrucomicrobiota bacterium]|nr:MAG: hypothetical protein CM1200mP29_00490 [Verrucomicrobiota bacterium]
MSITGRFFGNNVRIGTSTITRSVKRRLREDFDSWSPVERPRGSADDQQPLSSRLK